MHRVAQENLLILVGPRRGWPHQIDLQQGQVLLHQPAEKAMGVVEEHFAAIGAAVSLPRARLQAQPGCVAMLFQQWRQPGFEQREDRVTDVFHDPAAVFNNNISR